MIRGELLALKTIKVLVIATAQNEPANTNSLVVLTNRTLINNKLLIYSAHTGEPKEPRSNLIETVGYIANFLVAISIRLRAIDQVHAVVCMKRDEVFHAVAVVFPRPAVTEQ